MRSNMATTIENWTMADVESTPLRPFEPRRPRFPEKIRRRVFPHLLGRVLACPGKVHTNCRLGIQTLNFEKKLTVGEAEEGGRNLQIP